MNKCLNCNKIRNVFRKGIVLHSQKGMSKIFDKWVCSEKCKKEITKKANKMAEENLRSWKKISKEYLCQHCNYKWISKKTFGSPAICPKCRNTKIIRYAETSEWEKNMQKNKKQRIKDIISMYKISGTK